MQLGDAQDDSRHHRHIGFQGNPHRTAFSPPQLFPPVARSFRKHSQHTSFPQELNAVVDGRNIASAPVDRKGADLIEEKGHQGMDIEQFPFRHIIYVAR